jgi:hypothetical protein
MCLGRKGEHFAMMPPPIDGYKRNHNSHGLNWFVPGNQGYYIIALEKKKGGMLCYVTLSW